MKPTKSIDPKAAWWLVVAFGLTSLFADITYEGGRSIAGQYLALLGASGLVVGFTAGFGELIGYGFRLLAGVASDRLGRHWTMIFIGYGISLLSIPLIAMTTTWEYAALLIVAERLGKAIRSPSRDAILSYASRSLGRGRGFGLHEAMDQLGAILGPLLMSAILFYKESYQVAFAVLLLPALIALLLLYKAWRQYPEPQTLEVTIPSLVVKGFSKQYWIYVAAVCCIAAGYVDFSLIAYHLKVDNSVSGEWIPLFYSIAMAVDGASALLLGTLFDKKGLPILMAATLISSTFVLLVFSSGFVLPFLGMLLWGIGMGSQESIVRAVIAGLAPVEKRGTAYGLFYFLFGIAWFCGSSFMGLLYDHSIPFLILFSLIAQLSAIPLLYKLKQSSMS